MTDNKDKIYSTGDFHMDDQFMDALVSDNLPDELPNDLPPGCEELPAIPLRGMLVLPHSLVHLDVGREKSIRALDEAMLTGREIFLPMQKDVQTEDPGIEDIYQVGTICEIRQALRLPGGTVRLLVNGICRGRLQHFSQTEPYALAMVEDIQMTALPGQAMQEALMRRLRDSFINYAGLAKKFAPEVGARIEAIDDAGELADVIAFYMPLQLDIKQKVLEAYDLTARYELLLALIARETEILELEKQIGNRVHSQIDQNQKEYYLREQLRAINRELGDNEDRSSEIDEYRQRMAELDLPDYVTERLEKELNRLRHMPPLAAEANVVENYIDWVLDIPWNVYTTDNNDLQTAEDVLNADHYGLSKVKERILEYLSVRQMTNSLKGPILCLVGPPGVGKTSLAKSIARALNRNYVRLSL
ncbi:MAG: LON peptidase substrate-binding domain-containing protein, partial [Firmicutes bacterium]|nr:LON peptidase substrate-binding domain-containing protein [Bacillota bacterium]